ncbi:MAG: hypothetical protein JSV50_02950 [Desulfobacteraceae bacterium]|nr:MAG: hypothetical protein JSV50_02950 [Desulfobacteraceae bacterium]
MKKLFVLLAAVAFVAAFTAPAFAAEWSFYGSARMTTFWVDEDFGDFLNAAGADDDLDLTHTLQGNSRIGANVKVSDNLIGRFEYGTGVNVRLLYGEYNFGNFKMLVGQDYGPVNIFISNQVCPISGGGDDDMLPYGGVYGGRNPMVAFKFGGFKLAFLTPKSQSSGYIDPVNLVTWSGAETDVTLPKIEASYGLKLGGVSLSLQGGYQTFDLVNFADREESVDAYILALSAKYSAGPLYLAGNVYTGENLGNYGIGFGRKPLDTAGLYVDPTGSADVLDNDAFGFLLVAAFTANEMLRFEAGYGQAECEMDRSLDKDEIAAMYVQAQITFAAGVHITPEIGKIDYKDNMFKADEGSSTYYGLKWQINF